MNTLEIPHHQTLFPPGKAQILFDAHVRAQRLHGSNTLGYVAPFRYPNDNSLVRLPSSNVDFFHRLSAAFNTCCVLYHAASMPP